MKLAILVPLLVLFAFLAFLKSLGATVKNAASPSPARRKVPAEVWLGCGIGLVFFVLGASVFVWMLGSLLDERHVALKWPLAEATVLRSEFGIKDAKNGGGRQTSYSAFFSWTWERDGLRHEADNASSGSWSCSPAEPRSKIAAHPVGSRLAIRIDPDDPARSVVDEPPPGPRDYADLLIPAAFLLFSAVPFGFAIAARKDRLHSVD